MDYRTASPAEQSAIMGWAHTQNWLVTDVENLAKGYAIEHLITQHFSEVKTRKENLLNRTGTRIGSVTH